MRHFIIALSLRHCVVIASLRCHCVIALSLRLRLRLRLVRASERFMLRLQNHSERY